MIMSIAEIGCSKHCDNIGCALRGRDIDSHDLGESMRRSHKIGGKRVIGLHVIAEAALPAQKGIVFDPAIPGIVITGGS